MNKNFDPDWALDIGLTVEQAREQAKRLVAEWRYRDEQAGTILVNGVCYSTSREERAALASAMASGIGKHKRKCANGVWTTLTSAELKLILSAITNHVQNLFDKEAEEAEAIETMGLSEILKRYS